MVRTILIFLTLIIIVTPLAAQHVNDLSSVFEPSRSAFSLFDPNKFSMSHSYSFFYSSSRAGSRSVGMYLNSIEYQVSDPLRIRLDLGFMHNPAALFSDGSNASRNGVVVPSFSIDWRPTEKMFFRFNYQQVPAQHRYYDPYYYTTD